MRDRLQRLERHLHEALGVEVHFTPWPGAGQLPAFLRDRYEFHEAQLLGTPCLLMADRGAGEQPPATVLKHLAQVQARWTGEVVYVRERMTAYNRSRLIQERACFIVPGSQIHLPTMGVALRERLRPPRREFRKFSPATQALVIHWLLRGESAGATPSALAPQLGYSIMTLSRAFDELEGAGVGALVFKGRDRILGFPEKGRALWDKARPLMRSPVRRRLHLLPPDDGLPGPRAGLTALAHYTALAEPANPVCAMSGAEWKALQASGQLREVPVREPGALEVEVWSYAPRLFARGDVVDRLSLHLSLSEDQDERVQAALEELIGDVPW